MKANINFKSETGEIIFSMEPEPDTERALMTASLGAPIKPLWNPTGLDRHSIAYPCLSFRNYALYARPGVCND